MTSTSHYDAIVLGPGIAGLGVAIGLARRGKKVLVLGKRGMEGAASSRAAGILDPFLEFKPSDPLLRLGLRAVRDFPSRVRSIEKATHRKVGYLKTGLIYLAKTSGEVRRFRRRLRWQRKLFPLRWMGRDEVLKFLPFVGSKVRAGLFYPTIARIIASDFVDALRKYAGHLGIHVAEVSERTRILVKQDQVKGVRIGGRVWTASVVVNAAGSWAGKHRNGLGIAPVEPARGQILILKPRKTSRLQLSTILHSANGGYLVPWKDETFLAGSTVERAGFKPYVTSKGIRSVWAKVKSLVPEIESCRCTNRWAGLRPYSKIGRPLIGPTKIRGLYLAAGYFRSGILIGCYAGDLLAKSIVSGKISKELEPLSPLKKP